MPGMPQDLYAGGAYLEKNPLGHTDESPWKAKYVLHMMAKNGMAPKTRSVAWMWARCEG